MDCKMMKLSTAQFTRVLPTWHAKFGCWRPNLRVLTTNLETEISKKSTNIGYLDMNDLLNILKWGDPNDRHDLAEKLRDNNTDEEIQKNTKEAIQYLSKGNWRAALGSLDGIDYWGFTYGTKTLRLICPQHYPALDRKLRNGIKVLRLRRSDTSYGQFINLCHSIQKNILDPGPRPDGSWWIADVEMALYTFVRQGNELI